MIRVVLPVWQTAACLVRADAVALTFVVAFLSASGVAWAQPVPRATFNVTPTLLEIARPGASTSLMLRNESNEPLRFRVTAFRWSNADDGEMRLEETKDIVFFPAMFTVAAGQTRRVRVACSVRAGDRELAYRLILEQIPSEVEADPQSGVRMLTRLNVPLFIKPSTRTLTTTLDDVGVADGHIVFALRNTGTVHVRVGEILVKRQGRTRESDDTQRLIGWYLLPGEQRRYRLPVETAACRGWSAVTVTAALLEIPTRLEERALVETGACGRP